MSKIALITGATSGIGEATAMLMASHGVDLVICGRNQEKLTALESALSQQVKVHSLAFDVRNKEAVSEALSSLPEAFNKIDILVNNAGNAHGLGPIQDGDLEDWDAMIDINVKGLLYVTKAIVSGMIARGSGHIVNIGSVAGKEVYPNGNVYCASKFAVDALNQAMRLDLNAHQIKVSAINPGLVNTGFSAVRFKGDMERAAKVYQGMTPLVAEDIAEIIWFVVSRPKHVNIADLLVFPADQAASTIVNRKQ